MLRRLIIAGAVALGTLALPQLASAQGMEHAGPGAMGRGGPDQFRMNGGRGHFGGAGDFRFAGGHRPFGQGASAGGRFSGDVRAAGMGDRFRFREEGRSFGRNEGFGVRHVPARFAYGDRFREPGVIRDHRVFGRYDVRRGYRLGYVRPSPVYVGHRYRHVGFVAPYGGPELVGLPYGLPRGGCMTRRSVTLTPVGWHKIVTVRTCYVR